jgi:hypothetical protein
MLGAIVRVVQAGPWEGLSAALISSPPPSQRPSPGIIHVQPEKCLPIFSLEMNFRLELQAGLYVPLLANPGHFTRFLEAASFSQGALINISAVARECQVERSIAENYLPLCVRPAAIARVRPATPRE